VSPEILQRHLLKANEFVGAAERLVLRQRALFAELKQDGHDTVAARGLLDLMLDSLVLHKERQGWLRAEVGVVEERVANRQGTLPR
jgi:hypothetical protein